MSDIEKTDDDFLEPKFTEQEFGDENFWRAVSDVFRDAAKKVNPEAYR